MQTRKLFVAAVAAVSILTGASSCRKTIEVGNKPRMEFIAGEERITTDTTLVMDKKYKFEIQIANAEDQTPNTYFDISRTYSGGGDTTVFSQYLEGGEQVSYSHIHEFTTLKRAGTERFTFTVKNNYGIVNQKVLVVTVK
jgi:hypothetical protein